MRRDVERIGIDVFTGCVVQRQYCLSGRRAMVLAMEKKTLQDMLHLRFPISTVEFDPFTHMVEILLGGNSAELIPALPATEPIRIRMEFYEWPPCSDHSANDHYQTELFEFRREGKYEEER